MMNWSISNAKAQSLKPCRMIGIRTIQSLSLRRIFKKRESAISSIDPANLSDVAVRTIRDITLLETGPYIDLPHIIEEKYWDRGGEHLLRKTVLNYTTGAKIEKQEIYDAEGEFCCALETQYDEKVRPSRRINAIGQEEILSYDLCGNLKNHRDFSRTLETTIDTDFANRPIAQTQKGGISLTTSFFYDRKGNLICETDPRGHATRHDYDPLGQRITTHLPKTDSEAAVWQEYDSAGNAVLKIDAEGNSTRIAYNAYGKPTLTTYSDGAQEKSIYSLDGQLKTSEKSGLIFALDTDLGPKRFLLDTGANHSILHKSSEPKEHAQESRPGCWHSFDRNISYNGRQLDQLDFALAEIAEVFDVDGALGTDFLKRHVICLDIEHRIAYISPAKTSPLNNFFCWFLSIFVKLNAR